MLRESPYNQKTDIWALGCILYELVTSRRAFEAEGEESLKQRILSYQIPQLPSFSNTFESVWALKEIQNICMQRN